MGGHGGKRSKNRNKPPCLPKANRSSSQSQLLPHRHFVCPSSLRGQAETLPSSRWVQPSATGLTFSSAHHQETSHANNKRRRWLSLGPQHLLRTRSRVARRPIMTVTLITTGRHRQEDDNSDPVRLFSHKQETGHRLRRDVTSSSPVRLVSHKKETGHRLRRYVASSSPVRLISQQDSLAEIGAATGT